MIEAAGDQNNYGLLTGVAALITSLTVASTQLWKAGREWLARRRTDAADAPLAETRLDSAIAQSADSMVIALERTVKNLSRENERLVKRVAHLEGELELRARKIADLERRLRRAEVELRALADELHEMKGKP